jgi:Eukaryotic integral membrane protein (DUF1751)
MTRIKLPPVTKYSLVILVLLTTIVAVLRYTTYVIMVSDLNRVIQENKQPHSQVEIEDGRAYPPDPIMKSQVPRPGDLFVPYLTLVPRETPIFYPWVLITSTFVEHSILSFITTFSTILYGGKYCEHIWGSMELARFIGLLCVIPNFLTIVFYLIVAWIEGDVDEVGPTPAGVVTICGGAALITGFLVAFKQLVPQHTVVLFKGRIKFKVKRIPFIFLTTVTFFGIFTTALYSVMAWIGFFSSWVYLRFYRKAYTDPMLPFNSPSIGPVVSYEHSNPSGIRIRGDASDSFAMQTFFPEPFNFVIAHYLADPGYRLLVTLKLLTPFTQSEIESANSRAAARLSSMTPGASFVAFGQDNEDHSTYPRGNSRAEAERRRSMALRVMDREALRVPSPPAVHSKIP